MEYLECTSSFVTEDSESLLFVESLNLDVLIHEFGVRKVMDFSVQLSKGAPLVKLPGGVLLAIIEGVAALLMRPSKRKKGRVAEHLMTSLLQQKHATVAKGCETQCQETMNH